MADNTQDKIDQFNDELGKISDRIVDLGGVIGINLAGKLQDAINEARKMADPLKDAASISKKMNDLADKNETLIIKKRIAEEQYADAIRRGSQAEMDKNEILLKQVSAQLKIQQGIEDQLRKLTQVAEEEKKITEEKKKQNSLIGNAKTLFQDMVKPLTELFSVMGVLKAIVAGANNFDKISVNTSKTLGYTAGKANDVARNFQAISLTSQSTNVTMKSLAEATNELSEATGLVTEYSAETLKTQVMLTKQFGLTGEEAAGIYKFSVLSGKSSEKINDEMVGAFVASRNTLRVGANFKAVMAEAAKVSGQLAANFRNNPAEITKAIVQAKALGTTLEQSKNQGEALLNFESSLENELKAELLTGQQLNLERARAAALQGDQVTLMKELANQGMTLEKFQGMNVLAQKSYAEALGLSADALADQLSKQKLAQESGKSLAEITKDEALEAQKRQTIEDRFAATVEKLKDIIGSIGTLLAPAIQLISFLVDNTFVLYGVLGLIALKQLPAMAKGFKSIGNDIKESALNAKKLFSKEGRADLFGGIGAAGAKTPPVPAVPGAGATGGGMSSFMDKMPSATNMLKGAAAILILAGALFVAAKAFQEFAKVKWEDMAKAGVALVGLAAVAAIIGSPMIVGFVEAGAFALGSLGLALIPFALAARIATPAIEAFGNVILKAFTGLGTVITAAANGIATIFGSLQNVDATKLLAIGPALIGIGVGLASLGAGGVIAAIGSFLGGDPIKKIEALAASGDGLQKAATGLQGVALGLTQVSTALASIDTSKLEALSDFSTQMSIGSAVKGITDFITAPIKAIGSAIGGEGGTDNAPMVAAINEVRDAVNKLYTKNNDVYIDSVKVTTASQKAGNYKMS
jgi:hypothetical protein